METRRKCADDNGEKETFWQKQDCWNQGNFREFGKLGGGMLSAKKGEGFGSL